MFWGILVHFLNILMFYFAIFPLWLNSTRSDFVDIPNFLNSEYIQKAFITYFIVNTATNIIELLRCYCLMFLLLWRRAYHCTRCP